ncbi:MAG: SPOR domain-containing protein [Candidatus Omnitrophota bacterium]|nr:SPOR domain-containing protein [Candidatus Omnitrophota bacterium]
MTQKAIATQFDCEPCTLRRGENIKVMNKNNSFQLELFSKDGAAFQMRNSQATNSFSKFLKSYEKKALLVIGILIVSLISFSLGAEKGRREFENSSLSQITGSKKGDHQEICGQKQEQRKQDPIKKEDIFKKPAFVLNPNYTIQLASYKGRASAQAQAQRLKKKGLVTMLLTKGNYTVLCAGSFADKKTAQMNLIEFKKNFSDCCVRKIND